MLQAGDPPPDEALGGAGSAGRSGRAEGAEGVRGDAERLAVFDGLVAEVAARVEPAYGKADGWLEQTRAGLGELLRFCDERPDTARELVIDSIAWGPGVLRRRGQLLDELAAAVDRGRAESDPLDISDPLDVPEPSDVPAPSAGPVPAAPVASGETGHAALPPGTAENLVGACISLVHTRLPQARRTRFLELAPSLMSMIVHPYLGPAAARRQLERSPVNAAAGPAERDSEGTVAAVRERSY